MRCAHTGLFLLSTIWLPAVSQAVTFDCERVKSGKVEWNLEKLKGPHSVHQIQKTPQGVLNTTYTIDLCEALKKDDDDTEKNCPSGTRICASKTFLAHGSEEEPLLEDRWPIAGELLHDGGYLEPSYERLKSSKSNSDSDKEGLRIEFKGGKGSGGEKQKAIIELMCNKARSGLEGPSGKEHSDDNKEKRADDDNSDDDGSDGEDEEPSSDGDQSLQFVSYKTESSKGKDMGVLRLRWDTKYACEDQVNEKDPDDTPKKKNSWGFFAWFIIIIFLAIATYLIFGSWLNYNRYGARGWDLLPHSDTIRDLPYLVKDWGRRVVSTVQGNSGSGRGGYSAL